MVVFKYYGSFAFAPNELFRLTFNTAFIGTDNVIEVDRLSISPEKLQKETNMFGPNFKCQLYFTDYCKAATKCRSDQTPIEKICKRCKNVMLDEMDNWFAATKTLQSHEPMTQDEAK